MSFSKKFQDKSYNQHSEHFKEYTQNGEKGSHARTWFEKDTVDAWRHQRMYQVLDPILTSEPEAKWLTVGDGRYGKDSNYIIERGCDALPTDISEHLLKEAKELGFIARYKLENAESLSFQDSEFDYTFCKESYHHFPRPMLALYEMLRVSRSGVVLVEPNDFFVMNRFSVAFIRKIRNIIKIPFSRKIHRHSFEESGNYVYSLSRREIEKVALGLNYRMVAFKGINDAYFPGVEYEKMVDNGLLQRKLKRENMRKDFLCKLGILDYGLLASFVFKKQPSEELHQKLVDEGYEIIQLPNNPHIFD